MKKPKIGDTVMVTIPAKVVLTGRAGYMAQVINPEGFVYYKKPAARRRTK
jgi:hypothetical protein